MKYTDYYGVLGVARDADEASIKKAYRRLARKHHPDVADGAQAEARFKEVAQAYATLKDPARRAAYDRLGAHGAGDDFAPPGQWREFAGGTGGDADLYEFLTELGRRRSHPVPMRGRDLEATLRITLEDAHRGTTASVDIAHEDGTRTVAVTVPAGATEGQRLRLRGKGGRGRHGGPAGDVYLHIVLAPHPVFRPVGHDLHFDLVLAPWEAALGAEVEVPTLDGPVLLTVPAGTSSGRKLRLRSRGLSNGHGGRGDQYALVQLQVPTTLTARERELFEELARASDFNPRALFVHGEPQEASA